MNTTTTTELPTHVRAAAGDPRAFRELVVQHTSLVRSVVRSYVRSGSDTDDVVQEVFLKVHLYLGKFAGESSFTTWLHRIARNASIDALRMRRNVPCVDADVDVAECDPAMHDTVDPQRLLERHEMIVSMQSALDALSPDHRAVILMYEIDGMSYREMETALGVPYGTVMSRLFHARKAMQGMLSSTNE